MKSCADSLQLEKSIFKKQPFKAFENCPKGIQQINI